MTRIDAASWHAVSPLLDEMLDVSPEQRAVRLAQLEKQDPALAEQLAALLAQMNQVETEHFLEGTASDRVVAWTLAGQSIGGYTLECPIGEGGMGTVWLARRSDGHYEGHVAVKFVNLALLGRGGAERFRRESNALAKLAHPNITHLIDAGVAAGQPYIVMEYVEGEPIDRWCDQRRLDVGARVRLFLQVLSAVSHAHSRLILHRDLKPSNILVTSDGRAKLLDFGLAKLMDDDGQTAPPTDLSVHRGHAFTPEYAAPEQVQRSEATTVTDIYALGVLLHVLLTGTHPTARPTATHLEQLRALVEHEPMRLSDAVVDADPALAYSRASSRRQLARVLRGDLDNIVAKALKKSRVERYPTVDALADDLRRYLSNEPVSARADSVGYRVRKFASRHRAAVVTGSAAIMTLIAACGVALWQLVEANGQREVAQQEAARASSTLDVLYSVLSDTGAGGQRFTTLGLLAQAERVIDAQYGSSEQVLAIDQLVRIADMYSLLGQSAKALELAEAAHRRATKAGHAGMRRRAACTLGNELYVTGKLEDAQALLTRTIADLRGRAGEESTLIACLQAASDMDLDVGNSASAVARARETVGLSTSAFRGSPVAQIAPRMHLASALRVAGERTLADETFRDLEDLLGRLGRERSLDAVALSNNWGKLKSDVGDILGAARLIEAAVTGSRVLRPDGNPCYIASLGYGQTLLALHRLDEAERYFSITRRGAETRDDDDRRLLALLGLAGVERERGNITAASTALEAAREFVHTRFPQDHRAHNALLLETGRLQLATGSFAAAAAALSEVAAQAATSKARTPSHVLVLAALAQAELGSGEVLRAKTTAARARTLADEFALPGKPSFWIGYSLLVQSEIESAGSSAETGRQLAGAALAQLGPTVGADHPLTQRASLLTGA